MKDKAEGVRFGQKNLKSFTKNPEKTSVRKVKSLVMDWSCTFIVKRQHLRFCFCSRYKV